MALGFGNPQLIISLPKGFVGDR